MWSCRTRSSGVFADHWHIPSLTSVYRARRNERGHLEPDAADDVVQTSLGFGEYKNAPKAEVREEKQ